MTYSKEDKELNEMFHGEEQPLHPDTVHMPLGSYQKPTTGAENANTISTEEVAQNPTSKPTKENEGFKDAKWKPAKPDPNEMDLLKTCAMRVLLFGALSLLVFYWQQSGQMAASAAMPSLSACLVLAGCNIGKYTARGNH